MTEYPFLRFIDELVEVDFEHPALLEKSPVCPSSFEWAGEKFIIIEVLNEWRDFRRRGRMARNMQPQHAERAAVHGSWGVGRYYFRVKVEKGRVFDLYYDRMPSSSNERKGNWFLLGERQGGHQG